MKLAVIGGGSTYTPELADGIGRLLPGVTDFVLVDPDPARLAAVGPVSARIMAAHDHPARVSWTGSLDEGAEGADAILFQLRIGGQAARQRDETWPLDCGCVGQETTGAGGLAKALRTVPVVLDLAERVSRRASPSAFIIDFTNPVGIVTRALLTAGHRAVGLCNVAIGFQRDFASLLGVEAARVSLGHVGLNHLTWERSVLLDGVDVLPELLAKHADEIAPHTGMPADFIRHLGMVPSYYLRYFYAHDAVIEVPAVIGSAGANPVPIDPVKPLLRGLIAHVYAYEELALDAALRGGRDRVYDALLAHPLVGQADQAQCLTDRLIAENASFLSWT